jgi:hypothetical protein
VRGSSVCGLSVPRPRSPAQVLDKATKGKVSKVLAKVSKATGIVGQIAGKVGMFSDKFGGIAGACDQSIPWFV